MKTKCLILFLALVGGVIATRASADVPPKTPADLKQEASHVVVGTAQRVFVHREVVKKFGGSATWTTYLTQLKVESVEKGAGIAAGDIVYVKTWRNKWSGPGLPPPGSSGHWPIPKAGERLSVFFEKLNGLNHVVLQSGMSAAPKKKEKEGVIELRNAEGEPGLKRLNQATHIFSYSNDQTWLQFSFDRVPTDRLFNPQRALRIALRWGLCQEFRARTHGFGRRRFLPPPPRLFLGLGVGGRNPTRQIADLPLGDAQTACRVDDRVFSRDLWG